MEKTKEFQLLRVTKSLQTFLKSGEDTANASEIAALEARLEHNKKLQEKNLFEARVQLRRIDRQLNERASQNSAVSVARLLWRGGGHPR